MSGKGDAPRPCNREKWDACPLWRKVGPDARKDAQRKNRKNNGVHKCGELWTIRTQHIDDGGLRVSMILSCDDKGMHK